MIPHEKQMVEKLKDQPFALIGLNSDEGRDALLKIMKEQGITWRNTVNESTQVIAKQWNVTGWPTIYVLDAKGVIRYKGVRGQQMEEAVETLLKEVKAK